MNNEFPSLDFVLETAKTIAEQIRVQTPANVFFSWGVQKIVARVIRVNEIHRPALMLKVNGFNHKGVVYVAYNEGTDYYDIYKAASINDELQECYTDIDFEQLPSILDEIIEKGGMSQEEYEKRIIKECKLQEA